MELRLESGDLSFPSDSYFEVWASENLPEILLFGCFVDVHSFLVFMIDSGGRPGSLKNVVDRHRIEVLGDDAVTLESFTREFPRIFGSSESVSAL